jgi:hypothetical protein
LIEFLKPKPFYIKNESWLISVYRYSNSHFNPQSIDYSGRLT